MSDTEPSCTPPSEEEARRRHAAELHEQIEQLERGDEPDQGDPPTTPTPREFTDRDIHIPEDDAESAEDTPA